MLNVFKKFRADENGAVSADWVVLTASLVLLGISVFNYVSGGVTEATEGINESILSSITQDPSQ